MKFIVKFTTIKEKIWWWNFLARGNWYRKYCCFWRYINALCQRNRNQQKPKWNQSGFLIYRIFSEYERWICWKCGLCCYIGKYRFFWWWRYILNISKLKLKKSLIKTIDKFCNYSKYISCNCLISSFDSLSPCST